MQVEIYKRSNLAQLPWPQTPDGEYARRYLTPLIQEGTQAYIDNLDAEVQVLKYGEVIFPLVLGNLRPKVHNSYVASPLSFYIDYGLAELEIELKGYPPLRYFLAAILHGLGGLFKLTAFDQVVLVNNWLLSTNLYPHLTPEDLAKISQALIQAFPQRVIIFRSINLTLNQEIYRQLLALNYLPVLSRQVYILDPAQKSYLKKDSYRKDLRLQKRSPYQWYAPDPQNMSEIMRIRALYDDLYLHKYSKLNPQFNSRFIQRALAENWLKLQVLRKSADSLPDAVIGYFERDGVMTAPLVGYDRALPESTGLFRLATLKLLQEAVAQNIILHKSSGVSKFKLHRGAEPALEFNLIYYHHRPYFYQWPWRVTEKITRWLIIPMMKKLKL